MKVVFSITASEMHELAENSKYTMIGKVIQSLENSIKKFASLGYTCLESKLDSSDIREKDVPLLEKALREAGFQVSSRHYSTYTHTKITISW